MKNPLSENTISASWRPASSPDSPFLCLQWRSLPCYDDLWIWHYCVTDHRIYHVDWLACVGNAKPTRWASDDLWEWRRSAPQPQQASSTQFLPASLSHVFHKHLSHNSHDYASCDSHEYLSHKMRQTATNWSWPLSCVHATSSISRQSTFGLFGSKTSTVLRALFWRRPPVAIRYLGIEYKHLPREYISNHPIRKQVKPAKFSDGGPTTEGGQPCPCVLPGVGSQAVVVTTAWFLNGLRRWMWYFF